MNSLVKGAMAYPSAYDLQYFCEVAQTQNLSRAAERLGISQPTLTLAVKRLEDSFGLTLLIRTKTGVHLTPHGTQLANRAKTLLNQWDDLREEVRRNESEVRGRFTLGCHPSVALYSLHLFMQPLLERYPDLEFRLVHDLSRKITEDVISFKIDFAIVVNAWLHPDLVIQPLWEDEVSLWVSKKPSALQKLGSKDSVLIYDPDLIQAQHILKELARSKMEFQRTISTRNLEVISALVESGAGIGIIPGRVAERFSGLSRIKKSPSYHDKISLIYRADFQKSASSRTLAREMAALLKKS